MAWLEGKKTYLGILAVIAAVFTIILVYSEKGLVGLSQLKEEKARLEQVNEELRKENQRLIKKIERIKSDPGILEDEARKKLGLIRPDETIYRLREEPDISPGNALEQEEKP